jgi:hypothetical protein
MAALWAPEHQATHSESHLDPLGNRYPTAGPTALHGDLFQRESLQQQIFLLRLHTCACSQQLPLAGVHTASEAVAVTTVLLCHIYICVRTRSRGH